VKPPKAWANTIIRKRKIPRKNDSKKNKRLKGTVVPVLEKPTKPVTEYQLGKEDDNFVMTVWVGDKNENTEKGDANEGEIESFIEQNPIFNAINKTTDKNKLLGMFTTVYQEEASYQQLDWSVISGETIEYIQKSFADYAKYLLNRYYEINGCKGDLALINVFTPKLNSDFPPGAKKDYGWRERESTVQNFEVKRNKKSNTLEGHFFGYNFEIPLRKEDSRGVTENISQEPMKGEEGQNEGNE
jgi:hypothetical protein